MEVMDIEIDKIVIPERRVRATFTDEQMGELKASIEKNGFNIPVLVKPLPTGEYELIDGEHRIQIMKELGHDKIPAVVTDADDKKATMLNILANTARGDQNPMDVGEALKRAYDAGADEAELAAAMGHTKSWVKLYLTLPDLPDVYKKALRDGRLSVGHIREAMKLMDPVEIDAALQTAFDLGWKVNVLKYYVEQRLVELERLRLQNPDGIGAPPPTPEEAQEYVNYGDCMFCKRKVPREQLMMPVMCPDCRNLLEYILSQIPDPNKALETIYKALNMYFSQKEKEEKHKELESQYASETPGEITIPQVPVDSMSQQQPQQQPQQYAVPAPQMTPPQPQNEEKLVKMKVLAGILKFLED